MMDLQKDKDINVVQQQSQQTTHDGNVRKSSDSAAVDMENDELKYSVSQQKSVGLEMQADKAKSSGKAKSEKAAQEKDLQGKLDTGKSKKADKTDLAAVGEFSKSNGSKKAEMASKASKEGGAGGAGAAGADTAVAGGEKATDGAGGAGDAGGAGGGIDVPMLGAGAPTVSAKGPGAGKNSIEAFANSGLSYQFTDIEGLGDKATADVEKSQNEIDAKVPGEQGVEINDGTVDAQREAAVNESKAQNETVAENKEEESPEADTEAVADALKAAMEEVKNKINASSDEDVPDAPTLEADTSVVDQTLSDEEAKYASAQASGDSAVQSLDRTLPERGFDDLQTPKPEIEFDVEAIASESLPTSEEVAAMDDEAKGLMDISEAADQTSAQMASIAAEVDAAEADSRAKADEEIASHNEAVEQAKADAAAEEKAMLAEEKANLDSEIDAESASYQEELDAYNEEQKAEIENARSEIEAEREKSQAEIDKEHDKAQEDKKSAEKEADEKKDDKSWVGKAGDWVKSQVKKVGDWLKSKLAKIITAVKNTICSLIDKFVDFVSKINKDLGDKLRKAADKFKATLDKFASKIIDIANKVIDTVVEKANEIVDKTVSFIEEKLEELKNAIKAIADALRAAFKAAVDGFKKLLQGIANIYIFMLKKAMELAGIDPSVFANAMGVAKEIIDNPGRFFSALGNGFVGGFKNFGANIGENVKAIFTNLLNMWLGAAGLSLPGAFNLPNLIKFGFDIIGIDVNGILNTLGLKNLEEMDSMADLKDNIQEAVQNNPAYQMIQAIKEGGISAFVEMAKDYLGDLLTEIRNYAIETIVKKASTAALSKLAMLATPATGIVAAIKAVWDLIQFVRQNMSAINGLVNAVTSTLAQAAMGDSSGVAAGVEAALCRLIPLAIDLLLRLAGIDVGGAIQGVVGKIREKVQGVVDKVIGKIKDLIAKTPIGKAVNEAKEKVDNAKKDAADKVNSMVDSRINNTVDKFNNSAVGQKVSDFNDKAQQFANTTNAFTANARNSTGGTLDTMNTVTNALNEFNSAEKVGDAFGLTSDMFIGSDKKEENEAETDESKPAEAQGDANAPKVGDSANGDVTADANAEQTTNTPGATTEAAKAEESENSSAQQESIQNAHEDAQASLDSLEKQLADAKDKHDKLTKQVEKDKENLDKQADALNQCSKEFNDLCAQYNVNSNAAFTANHLALDGDMSDPIQAQNMLITSSSMNHLSYETRGEIGSSATNYEIAAKVFELAKDQWEKHTEEEEKAQQEVYRLENAVSQARQRLASA